MPTKKFRLAPDELKRVAVGYGACIASDRIMVDGLSVGYCYREATVHSGWRFFPGDESDAYAENPDDFASDDIDPLANRDPSIARLIESPVGSMVERDDMCHWMSVRLDAMTR